VLTIRYTPDFRIEKPTILTIGTFDGVHYGHQQILKRLNEVKRELGLQTALLTFDPHPRKVLFPEQKDLKLLTPTDEKLELLKQNGVDITIVYPFNKAFAQMDAKLYISNILCKSLKVKHLIIGYDHKFGKNRDGDMSTLKTYASELNYTVEEISAQDIDNINVSSSKIRHAIDNGDITLANKYLGYSYFINGTVIKAKQLGRTIGYPTANIRVSDPDKLIPAIGVYLVEVAIEKEKHYGMLNIGKNPTTDSDDSVKIEVNLFNFDRDIYGSRIRVNFLQRIRNEHKFNGIEELKEQLGKDKAMCLGLIEKQNY
jgi:riboflavin kinase/FMN adenylyltransferase